MDQDNVEKTRRLIRNYLARGYSDKVIRNSFANVGYDKSTVTKILKQEEGGLRGFNWKFVYIGIAVSAIVLLALLLFIGLGNDCDNDMVCFVEAANKCNSVTGYFFLEGNKISLDANDCTLTKKIVEFDESEPVELVILLEDKEMVCEYGKGDFDESFLDFVGGIEKCSGDLKDTLINIRLAQLELEENLY